MSVSEVRKARRREFAKQTREAKRSFAANAHIKNPGLHCVKPGL
ncbi:hypothetical protein [uncultured Treponema sp.]|nr:hypothetical protein [uncultured Treponema sp.]